MDSDKACAKLDAARDKLIELIEAEREELSRGLVGALATLHLAREALARGDSEEAGRLLSLVCDFECETTGDTVACDLFDELGLVDSAEAELSDEMKEDRL